MRDTKHVRIAGKLVMVGFGSVGQATLPLLLRHIDIDPKRIRIVAADNDGLEVARSFDIPLTVHRLTEEDCESYLAPLLEAGDFLLNLSVDVSSLTLIKLCWRLGVLYLDTCIEPWPGGYGNAELSLSQRSNYALREDVLAFRLDKRKGPTAVVTQGANPGLASVFVKQALLDLAADSDITTGELLTYEDWAELARRLTVRVIHIAERDSQVSPRRKTRGEFVNTWSVVGFADEGWQPAELGWGTHEKYWPDDAGRHGFGCDAAIYLQRPGGTTRVRSWTPLEGPYQGFLIPHGEAISIAHHLTLGEKGKPTYRPTVNYAYYPCDDAVLSLHELAGRNGRLQDRKRIIRDDVASGMDELGVLLMGNARGVYWYGSRLSIDEARKLARYNNATSMQVAAGILGGLVWAVRNPGEGVVEPDDLDFRVVLDVAKPYLGELIGVFGDWTPLDDRNPLFPEDIDPDDPWQFKNFRVR